MAASLTGLVDFQAFTDAGLPLVGGRLYSYTAGTTTLKLLYTEATGTTPFTYTSDGVGGSYIALNARGELPNTPFLLSGAYDFTLKRADGTTVWTRQGVGTSDAASGVLATFTAFVAQLLTFAGASLIGYILGLTGSVLRTVQDKLRETVSVKDFGSGVELGALINAAVTAGATSIMIPTAANWTWTTVVTLPALWRGRIFSEAGYGVQTAAITASTGHTIPCIDAQGALFVEVEGLHVVAAEAGLGAPACFMVIARMPSGASAGNHRVSRNLIEGPFYYGIIYNVGGEELVFENNYFALFGTTQAVSPKIAPVIHQLSEDAFYSGILTKAARTNGTSTSAIQHRGDVVKNQNAAGCSAVYLGPNVNDILFDLNYMTSPASSYCFYAAGYCDGIRIGVERIETDKTTPIFAAPIDVTMGSVSLYKGAYRRSGAVDSTHYAVDIGGTTASSCVINIAPEVSWTGAFGGGVEDIYLVRSTRKTVANLNFMSAGPEETVVGSKVNITQLIYGEFVMGLSANLTLGSTVYGYRSLFFYDPASTKQAHVLGGGAIVKGRPFSVNGVVGGYQAADSTLDTTSSGIHWYFLNPNGVIGSISSANTTTSFSTTSDATLKDDDGEVDGAKALAAVLSWKIHNYRWKSNGAPDIGPFAQELREVKPSAVVGAEGAVHVLDDGTEVTVPLGVDLSKLIPELVAAVQFLAKQSGQGA